VRMVLATSHPERSEGSAVHSQKQMKQILRVAQDDGLGMALDRPHTSRAPRRMRDLATVTTEQFLNVPGESDDSMADGNAVWALGN